MSLALPGRSRPAIGQGPDPYGMGQDRHHVIDGIGRVIDFGKTPARCEQHAG